MTQLSLSLLGPFQANLEGRPITEFYSNKVRALLAYLAVEAGRLHARPVLAALLWPDWADRAALGNLRFSLSRLRRSIGDEDADPPFLLITRDTVQLNPSADCYVDLRDFECKVAGSHWELAVEDGQPAPRVQAAIRELEAAVDLYRGTFLEGFAVGDSPSFEEWVLLKREQSEQILIAALHGLAALYQRFGDHAESERWARRLLELDPWDDRANRQLMAALAGSGQRNAALRHYALYRETVAKELGTEPTAETTAEYEQIRRGSHRAPVSGGDPAPRPRPAPSPGTASRPFVAREPQLADLHGYLDRALCGQGSVAFATGEAGSGKTALLAEFAREAMEEHPALLVTAGRCDAYGSTGAPYVPFREIIQMLAGDFEARRAAGEVSEEHARRLWAALPEVATALLETAPDLIDRFVKPQTLARNLGEALPTAWRTRLSELAKRGPPVAGALEQGDLFEEFTGFLLALARTHPLLLLLDDLQWADEGSLSLLFHLGRRLAGARILVACAYRPEDVTDGRNGSRHPLLAVVNELRRVHGERAVDLDQADGRRFVSAIVDSRPNRLGSDFRETLFRHTGGHALFTIELLRDLRCSGKLVQDDSGAWVEAGALEEQMLPPRVDAVIAERIGRLPEAMQSLLAAASVEGMEFTGEVVARVLGLDRIQTLHQLSQTLGRHHRLICGSNLVWPGHGRPAVSRYRFRHFLFREYLYQRLDPLERARLHQLTGEALEGLYGPQASEIVVQLAYHFEQAGDAARAVDYLLEAGDQAARVAAYKEAAEDFSRGLSLLAALPDTPERAERELRLRLALAGPLVALRGLGPSDREHSIGPAVPLSRQAGGAHAAYALMLEASAFRDEGNFGRAIELGQQLLALAASSGDRQTTMLGHYIIGSTEAFIGEALQGRAGLEAALDLYNESEDRSLAAGVGGDLKAVMLSWLAPMLWALGYPMQASERAAEAIGRAQELNQPALLGAVLVTGAWLAIYGRTGQDPRPLIERLQRVVVTKGVESVREWAAVYGGWLLTQDGQVAEGVEQMRNRLAAWWAAKAPGPPGLLVITGQVCLQAGLYDEGLAAIGDALSMLEAGLGHHFEAEMHRLRGALMLAKAGPGSTQTAEACFLRAIEIAREGQARSWELRATIDLARLWYRMAAPACLREQAYERLAAIYSQFTEGFDTPDLLEARGLLEELAVERG